MLPALSNLCFELRQHHCITHSKGNAYKAIFPTLSKQSLVHNQPHSPTIFRLCTGHCRLNHHLFRIGLHPDGLCDYCAVPETVDHFLTSCTEFHEARERLKQAIAALGLDTTVILQHTRATKPIASFIKDTGKRI